MAKLSEGESSGDLLENQQQISSKQSHCRKSILPNFLPDLKENHIFVEYDTEETGLEINVKSSDLRQTQLNGYVVDWIGAKHKRQTRDLRLWKEYIQSFKDWTIEIFNFTNEQACNGLRDYLRTSGVFVNSGPRARVQDSLLEILNESKPHVWTKAEVEEVMEEFPHQFNSKYNPDLEISDQRNLAQNSPDLTRKINQNQEQKPDIRQNQESYKRIQNQTPPNHSSHTTSPNYHPPNNNQNRNNGFNSNHQNAQQYSGPQSYPSGFLSQPINACSQNPLSSGINPQENVLSQNINYLPLTANIGRELGTLQRIYQSDMQYGGASDDFDLCLKIFYDCWDTTI